MKRRVSTGKPTHGRPVFHGRRVGRALREGRREALDEVIGAHGIALPDDGPLDPGSLFGDRPVWMEIGFGSGEHLADVAAANPDTGIIGCEPFINGVSFLGQLIAARGLDNVRIFADDARPLLDRLPDASIGRVFLLFPDPWPKRRHHERRFINPENLARLARVMRPGAELRLASDDMGVASWMLEHAGAHPDFRLLTQSPADWLTRPADWPQSRYERKGADQGRRAAYFRLERR